MVVLNLDEGGSTQNFQQHSHTFAGHVLHNALETAECAVLELHLLAGLDLADFLKARLVAHLFELADAPQQFVFQRGRFKPETHQVVDAFGVAHHRNALSGLTGPEKDIARKHGLEYFNRALRCFFVLLVQRQIGFEVLLLQVVERNFFKTWLGAGQIPDWGGGHGFICRDGHFLAFKWGECKDKMQQR